MKAGFGAALLIFLMVCMAPGQQPQPENFASKRPKPAISDEARISSLLNPKPSITIPEVHLGKKTSGISTPAPQGSKVKRVWEASKRKLQLINPFASSESNETLESKAGLSPRAWTTSVGLNPGGSAFPTSTTHESSMSFVSLRR